MRPFFKYFGSKYTLSKLHRPPSHSVIIEPFAGSACYSVVHGANMSVRLFDANQDIIALWTWLRDASVREILSLPTSGLEAGQDIREFAPSHGAALFIRSWQRVGRGDCWTVSKWGTRELREARGYKDNGLWGERVTRRLIEQQPAIQRWEFFCCDYAEINTRQPATWFVDPPYQMQPSGLYGTAPISYPRLSEWCLSLAGQVIVCENEGADWLPFAPLREGLYRNTHGNTGRKMREMAWVNNCAEDTHNGGQ